MKTFTKKQIISLLLVFAVLFNLVPFSAFTLVVHAATEINEIRLTSSTTSVQSGTLPEFSVSTTTEHVTSIDSYGSNTRWNYRGQHDQTWKGLGVNTPTAVEDGTTHYGLNTSVNVEDGYVLDENTKIYFNDVDVTSNGYTEVGNQYSWGGYITIDLGTAGHELETYTITYDSNGGSGTMASHTAKEGIPEPLRQCTFTPPAGKTFDSWKVNGVSGYHYMSKYTFTADTTVYAVWKDDSYIRTSNATMTPNAINSNICANDIVFTSAEPSKYSVALWRVYDFTDVSLNTTYLNEYPHDKKFVEGHVYSIEMEFIAVSPYEYDVSHEENGSRFYINGEETVMSKAVDLPYSNLRRTERTAVASGNPAPTHTVTFHLNGGTMTSQSSVVVNDGSLVTRPTPNPTKYENTFEGWFTDDTYQTSFYFNLNLITEDTNIYAKWNSLHIHTLTQVSANASTCTETGNDAYYKCSVCDKYFTDALGTSEILDKTSVVRTATGHNWGDWVETTPATESTDGEETRTCTNNPAHTETRPIPKLTHTHTLTPTAEVPATCSTTGTEAYWTCSGCHKMFSDSEGTNEIDAPVTIAKVAHTWNDGVITTPATCLIAGVKTYTCTVCGDTKTETIAKKAHTLETVTAVAPTCENAGTKAHYKCSECEKTFADSLGTVEITSAELITSAIGHDWGEWVETTPATTDSEGVKTRTCKNDSSHKDTTSIDKLPYAILEGADQTFTIDTSKDIVIRANGTFNKFLGLKMDGKDIDTKYYTAVSGSTVVTLKQAYLDTLDEGNHTLTFVYTDGTIDTTLKIAKADIDTPKTTDANTTITTTNTSSSPKTGDNIVLWIGLMLVSALGVIGTIKFIKKRD